MGLPSLLWSINVILREFEHPVGRHDGIWTPGALAEKKMAITCPACGDASPVMGDVPFGESAPCPKCGGSIHCEIVGWS